MKTDGLRYVLLTGPKRRRGPYAFNLVGQTTKFEVFDLRKGRHG